MTGLVGDLSADFILRDGDQLIFSIGPRARWADNNFHDAYFGVTFAIPAIGLAALRSGQRLLRGGGRAGLTQRLGRNWGLFGYAGYDRLIGDAADSPIVRMLRLARSVLRRRRPVHRVQHLGTVTGDS